MPGAPLQLDRPLEYRDLTEAPDDGRLYEVIDGELHVSPFPTYAHQEAVGQLFTILNQHVRDNRLGKVFPPGLMVILDEPTGVGPDIVYVSASRMPAMKTDGYHGAPDLVVEVVSSKPNLDRVVKAKKYAQAAIPHYWIVDPDAQTLHAYALVSGHYRLQAQHEGTDAFHPALFAGLTVQLADLWV